MGEPPAREEETGSGNVYMQLLRLKALHLLAPFILAYVGVEVTIGGEYYFFIVSQLTLSFWNEGWIVTYTIDVRGGGPASGYISSGFFGGIALGRVLLLYVTKKVLLSFKN